MCDAYTPAGEPIPTNKRYDAAKIFSQQEVVQEETWYELSLPLPLSLSYSLRPWIF